MLKILQCKIQPDIDWLLPKINKYIDTRSQSSTWDLMNIVCVSVCVSHYRVRWHRNELNPKSRTQRQSAKNKMKTKFAQYSQYWFCVWGREKREKTANNIERKPKPMNQSAMDWGLCTLQMYQCSTKSTTNECYRSSPLNFLSSTTTSCTCFEHLGDPMFALLTGKCFNLLCSVGNTIAVPHSLCSFCLYVYVCLFAYYMCLMRQVCKNLCISAFEIAESGSCPMIFTLYTCVCVCSQCIFNTFYRACNLVTCHF